MSERYSTIPDDLSGLFEHIQVEDAMRNKLNWLENKVKELLNIKPTYDEASKFLFDTQDQILGVDLAQLFAGFDSRVITLPSGAHARGNTPLVRFPFPNETMAKK